jgi:hypothetical protein
MNASTKRRNDPARDDSHSRLLALGGVGFLTMSGFFLWRDLALPAALVLLVLTSLAALACVARLPRSLPFVAPAALLASVVAGGLWFLATKSADLLPALGAGLVGSVVALVQLERREEWPRSPLPGQLTWYAAGAAFLTASWAFYFRYLTLDLAADSLARRLIPTIAWLAVGLATFIAGRQRRQAAVQVGVGLLAVALCKAIGYDTTHLAGWLRVGVLGAVGGLLLAGARLLRGARNDGAAAIDAEEA